MLLIVHQYSKTSKDLYILLDHPNGGDSRKMKINNSVKPIVERRRDKILAKLREMRGKKKGGIFTPTRRYKLLGVSGLPGRPGREVTEPTPDFRWKTRECVKRALIDLQIFIEFADKDDVNMVITRETLMPVVEALLWHPVVEQARPDLTRAEIAQMFIQQGFNYLQSWKIPSVVQKTIGEAIDISHFLVESFKPESERRYITPSGAY